MSDNKLELIFSTIDYEGNVLTSSTIKCPILIPDDQHILIGRDPYVFTKIIGDLRYQIKELEAQLKASKDLPHDPETRTV